MICREEEEEEERERAKSKVCWVYTSGGHSEGHLHQFKDSSREVEYLREEEKVEVKLKTLLTKKQRKGRWTIHLRGNVGNLKKGKNIANKFSWFAEVEGEVAKQQRAENDPK